MENGKIRHPNHMIDSRAIQFLQNLLPIEWVARTIQPDYGLDLDLELFDYENEKCVTLGEHIFLQVKGTENPTYSKSHLFGPENEAHALENKYCKIDVINYSLEVSMLNLVERMGGSLPVLLVVVDLKCSCAYFVCLNDYIRHVLPYQSPDYKSQKNVTIHIPTESKLSVDSLRWYGKRMKICSLLQEILAVSHDCFYLQGEELVEKVQLLVNRIQDNDAWNARVYWGFMYALYVRMQELLKNGMYDNDGEQFAKICAENSEDWRSKTLYVGFEERSECGLTLAQETSCNKFLSLCSAMLSNFENDARHLWLPTYLGWGISHTK